MLTTSSTTLPLHWPQWSLLVENKNKECCYNVTPCQLSKAGRFECVQRLVPLKLLLANYFSFVSATDCMCHKCCKFNVNELSCDRPQVGQRCGHGFVRVLAIRLRIDVHIQLYSKNGHFSWKRKFLKTKH